MNPRITTVAQLSILLIATSAWAQEKADRRADLAAAPASVDVLPFPDFRFQGSVGRTIAESDPPEFPQPVRPPKGALHRPGGGPVP